MLIHQKQKENLLFSSPYLTLRTSGPTIRDQDKTTISKQRENGKICFISTYSRIRLYELSETINKFSLQPWNAKTENINVVNCHSGPIFPPHFVHYRRESV